MTVTLVVGPFGAGKSTYIRTHVQPRELIIDGTALPDTIMAGPRVYLSRQRSIAGRLYWTLIDDVAAHPVSCWIECDRPTRADRVRILDRFPSDRWHRRIVALVPNDPQIAITQARNDPHRLRGSGWSRLVTHWYDRYEPVTVDEADDVSLVGIEPPADKRPRADDPGNR